MTAPAYSPGLDGVVAAKTRLSLVDGAAGQLVIAGLAVQDLAPRATFEGALFLLWNDRVPTSAQTEALRRELAALRSLPERTVELLRRAAQAKVPVIDALRMGVASLESSGEAQRDARLLVAASPVIVATYWRFLQGQPPVAPDPALSLSANHLWMLSGKKPSDARVRALDTYLCTIIDHGLNASTFTARVIVATQSDLVSAATGAIGALKGPLHGGAPGPALDMVFEIGEASRAESVLRAKLARGERLMGFGHRVYKVRDPRADVLAEAARKLYSADADKKLYELATHVEGVALKLLEEAKPGRSLKTNVEFYTALVLHGLELPTELFTPTFAIGRMGGWTAHMMEQIAENRMIRPQSIYVGATGRTWS